MEEIYIESWDEFKDSLKELRNCRNRFQKEAHLKVPSFLYRGQTDSNFHLRTTLERYLDQEISLIEYYELAFAAKPKVETFTKRNWDILELRDFKKWVEQQTHIHFINMPGYEYFAYLRHHGFPSPLLDWTESVYVALFFANRCKADNVKYCSIFVYLENTGKGKIGSSDIPYIITLGPYANIHKRHFLQQSNYTTCTIAKDNDFIFHNHEIAAGDHTKGQDLIWKLNIDTKLRYLILKKLNEMNVNAFSLFGTEDSLMESTAVSEIILRESKKVNP